MSTILTSGQKAIFRGARKIRTFYRAFFLDIIIFNLIFLINSNIVKLLKKFVLRPFDQDKRKNIYRWLR